MSLKTMIRDKGLRQGWLAHKMDMDDSTFSLIVSGKKALPEDKVAPLARLLGVPSRAVLDAIQREGA
jgi:plasmid maintenance system antidote protein VapI